MLKNILTTGRDLRKRIMCKNNDEIGLSVYNFNLFISEISYELDRLSGKLKVIKIEKVLHEMGFPNNFKEIVRLEKWMKNKTNKEKRKIII